MPHDRESQSESALFSRNRTFRLPETIEHIRQKLRRDAFTSVSTARRTVEPTHFKLMVTTPPRCVNLIAFESRFQITCRKRFVSPFTRQSPLTTLCSELNPFDVRGGPQSINSRFDNRREIQRMQIETKIPGDDARNVEQVVDQTRLRTRVTLDSFNRARRIRSFNLAVSNHRRPTENRSQRRAQLVRERGEKLVFQTIRFFSVLPRVALANQQRGAFFFRFFSRRHVENQRQHGNELARDRRAGPSCTTRKIELNRRVCSYDCVARPELRRLRAGDSSRTRPHPRRRQKQTATR